MDNARPYTTKQMADACEMLVAGELTLAGVPALKVPDNWPGYDVIAQPPNRPPQRIQVKARTYSSGAAFVDYKVHDVFDWLAAVILHEDGTKAIYLIPRAVADEKARQDKPSSKTAALRYYRIDEMDALFGGYRDNYALSLPAYAFP